MSWESVREMVVVLLSAGSIGAIIYAAGKNLLSRALDYIQQKGNAKRSARLDNLGHRSKAYFDIETATYQELCSAFYLMISAVHWLFPTKLDRAPAIGNLREICNDRYKTAQETYNGAATVLGVMRRL